MVEESNVKSIPQEEVNSVPSAVSSPLDRAENFISNMDERIAKFEELTRRNEEAATHLIMSGRTQAGSVQKSPEEIEKEKIEEDVQGILKSFGFRPRGV